MKTAHGYTGIKLKYDIIIYGKGNGRRNAIYI